MKKRLLAAFICILVVLASGCDLIMPVQTEKPTASTSAVSSSAPEPSASADATATGEATASPTQEPTSEPTEEPTVEPTVEPTEKPTPQPTPTPDPEEGMIFPDSDTELLMWDELIALKADKLDLARNEIFARAGYKFTKQYTIDYYGKLSWYKADPAFSESNFTDIQKANIALIRAAESALKGGLFEIKSGTKLDYDQDGVLETLTFTFSEYKVNLKMKDGSTTTPWDIECENPINKVYLGDIDFKDGVLDLFVNEAGPSDDYAVHVAGLKHKSFLQRGEIPGSINSGSEKSSFKTDGKGAITTLGRMDTVGTDFFIVKYKLDSAGKLVFAPASSYDFGPSYVVKTKVVLKLKKSASSTSAVLLTVPVGTKVQFVSTDAKKWVRIKAPGGTGWLELAEPLKLKDPNITTWEAFDGLYLAD